MNYNPGDKIKTKHGELTIKEVHITKDRIKYKCPHGDGFVYVEHGEVEKEWRVGMKVKITDEKYGHEFKVGEVVTLTEFDSDDYKTPWWAEGVNDEWWISEDEAELI